MKMEFASEEAKHFFITHTHTTSFFILFDFSKGQKGQKEQKEQKEQKGKIFTNYSLLITN